MTGALAFLAPYAVIALVVLGVRSWSPSYRAQRRRLGGRRAQARFRRAWGSGRVPDGVDRDLWLAELEHWPPRSRFLGSRRTLYWMMGITVAALTVLVLAGGPTNPAYVAAALLPIVAVFLPLAAIPHFLPDPEVARERRTQRLRERLESLPPTD